MLKIKLLSKFLCVSLLVSCGTLGNDEQRDLDLEVQSVVENTVSKNSLPKRPKPGVSFIEHLRSSILHDPEVAAAQYAIEASIALVSSARSQIKPKITGSTLAGAYNTDLGSAGSETGASFSVQVSQLLYDGGASLSNISGAELEVELSRAALDLRVNEVAYEAASVWSNLWLAQSDLNGLENLSSELSERVAQVKRMAETGLIDRSISEVIDGRLIDLEIQRRDAQSQLDVAKYAFADYFGVEAWNVGFPSSAPIVQTEKLDTDIPQIREAALRVLAAREQVKVTQSKFSPIVALEASGSSPLEKNDKPNAQLGLVVTYNFYEGGKRKADLMRAEREVDRTEEILLSVQRDVSRSLADLRERRSNLIVKIKLQSDKIASINRQLQTAEAQIQTGQADVAKVFEMKLQRHQLQASVRRARADLISAEYQIAALFGAFNHPNSKGSE